MNRARQVGLFGFLLASSAAKKLDETLSAWREPPLWVG